jgi:hypothetical protein
MQHGTRVIPFFAEHHSGGHGVICLFNSDGGFPRLTYSRDLDWQLSVRPSRGCTPPGSITSHEIPPTTHIGDRTQPEGRARTRACASFNPPIKPAAPADTGSARGGAGACPYVTATCLCESSASPFQGYEDELYCPPGYCLRSRAREPGFAGPSTAFNECAGSKEGSPDVTASIACVHPCLC